MPVKEYINYRFAMVGLRLVAFDGKNPSASVDCYTRLSTKSVRTNFPNQWLTNFL